jgi:hypothetical protein
VEKSSTKFWAASVLKNPPKVKNRPICGRKIAQSGHLADGKEKKEIAQKQLLLLHM